MPENTYAAAERRSDNAQPVRRNWFRREPGLTAVFLGLGVMLLALLLPQEQRTMAFYPAIALVVIGTLLTLRHGPDKHQDFR
ncbi:MAG TPA: hypothetical protein VN602_00975 [Gemmatimonadaceae bacterium]|nr:hypothetical protein [Gemmatimonadaceae bacterium]